jgi:hypothetical protein
MSVRNAAIVKREQMLLPLLLRVQHDNKQKEQPVRLLFLFHLKEVEIIS